jgi:hypothetical protein
VRAANQKLSRSRALVFLRFTLIIAISYLLLAEQEFSAPDIGLVVLLGAALLSNLVVMRLPARITDSTTFTAGMMIGDTAWITATLLYAGRFNAEFFLLYFFVLLLAAIGENLRLIAIVSPRPRSTATSSTACVGSNSAPVRKRARYHCSRKHSGNFIRPSTPPKPRPVPRVNSSPT